MLMLFEKDEKCGYLFKSAEKATEDRLFGRPVKELFPSKLAEIDADGEELSAILNGQSLQYAEAYLIKIGRANALQPLNSRNTEDLTMLQTFGVSEDVAAVLYDLHPEYGVYVGSIEKVENGVRYVYTVEWNGDSSGNGSVYFTKSKYDGGKIVEKYVYKVRGDKFERINID